MNLLEVDANDFKNRYGRNFTPAVNFNRKGLISLNKSLVHELLKDRDNKAPEFIGVKFFQNQDDKKDWYLELSGDVKAFGLKELNGAYKCNSAAFTKFIMDSYDVLDNTLSVKVVHYKDNLYQIVKPPKSKLAS